MKKEIQKELIDEDLRNGLWNCMLKHYLNRFETGVILTNEHSSGIFARNYWENYLKLPLDTLPTYWSSLIAHLRPKIISGPWNEVYDIIEFLVTNFDIPNSKDNFSQCFNDISTREFSAYRLVGDNVVELTSKEEIDEIEEVLQIPIDSVKTHIQNSLEKISDKQKPDYRNSIKESISAVESICKLITGNSSTTMGAALNEIESRGLIELHSDMKEAFQKLYHYTSDAGGIRHALMDETLETDFDDAKFMLVSCSAIVNYLISKANKAGINLS